MIWWFCDSIGLLIFLTRDSFLQRNFLESIWKQTQRSSVNEINIMLVQRLKSKWLLQCSVGLTLHSSHLYQTELSTNYCSSNIPLVELLKYFILKKNAAHLNQLCVKKKSPAKQSKQKKCGNLPLIFNWTELFPKFWD